MGHYRPVCFPTKKQWLTCLNWVSQETSNHWTKIGRIINWFVKKRHQAAKHGGHSRKQAAGKGWEIWWEELVTLTTNFQIQKSGEKTSWVQDDNMQSSNSFLVINGQVQVDCWSTKHCIVSHISSLWYQCQVSRVCLMCVHTLRARPIFRGDLFFSGSIRWRGSFQARVAPYQNRCCFFFWISRSGGKCPPVLT